jgi:hypothetical protein
LKVSIDVRITMTPDHVLKIARRGFIFHRIEEAGAIVGRSGAGAFTDRRTESDALPPMQRMFPLGSQISDEKRASSPS